jgi:hypothetical protein
MRHRKGSSQDTPSCVRILEHFSNLSGVTARFDLLIQRIVVQQLGEQFDLRSAA